MSLSPFGRPSSSSFSSLFSSFSFSLTGSPTSSPSSVGGGPLYLCELFHSWTFAAFQHRSSEQSTVSTFLHYGLTKTNKAVCACESDRVSEVCVTSREREGHAGCLCSVYWHMSACTVCIHTSPCLMVVFTSSKPTSSTFCCGWNKIIIKPHRTNVLWRGL